VLLSNKEKEFIVASLKKCGYLQPEDTVDDFSNICKTTLFAELKGGVELNSINFEESLVYILKDGLVQKNIEKKNETSKFCAKVNNNKLSSINHHTKNKLSSNHFSSINIINEKCYKSSFEKGDIIDFTVKEIDKYERVTYITKEATNAFCLDSNELIQLVDFSKTNKINKILDFLFSTPYFSKSFNCLIKIII